MASSSPAGIRKCANCGLIKEPKLLMKCSRCKNPNYVLCSKECQAADWKRHKKEECQTLEKALEQMNMKVKKKPLTLNSGRPTVGIINVCDPGHKLGFMYTVGLHREGLPELIAVDIPVEMATEAQFVLGHLAENSRIPNKVFHGYKFEQMNYNLVTLNVTRESHRRSIIKNMGVADLSARVLLVKPLWDSWTDKVPVPTVRQESILGKWRQYRTDHPPPSTSDEPPSALLEKALLSMDSSNEWERYLIPKQIQHVKKNKEYMVKIGLTELCFPPMDKKDTFICDVAENLHLAPRRYLLGIKVAQGHYTWDL